MAAALENRAKVMGDEFDISLSRRLEILRNEIHYVGKVLNKNANQKMYKANRFQRRKKRKRFMEDNSKRQKHNHAEKDACETSTTWFFLFCFTEL